MRILFVSEFFPPVIKGGGEINLFTMAKALVEKGHLVSVLTSHQENLLSYERMGGITVYRRVRTGENINSVSGNLRRSLFLKKSVVREIKKLTQENNYDVIHFIGASISAAPEVKELGVPLVTTVESYPALCPKGDRIYHGKEECTIRCSFQRFISCQKYSEEIGKMKNKAHLKYNPLFLSYVYRHHQQLQHALSFCNIIAISVYVQKLLLQHGFESTVIPNALDMKPFLEAQKEKDNPKINILYLGSLTHFKGVQILFEALNGLPYHCDLYGEGVLKEKLQAMILEHNIDAAIHAPVNSEEVPFIYAAADIVVVPSLWPEPFGRIPIEAMAAGRPVIASNIAGLQETLSAGGGLLFAPGNVEELRTLLQQLVTDMELRNKLGEEGRRIVQEKYEQKIIAQKILDFYQSLLKP